MLLFAGVLLEPATIAAWIAGGLAVAWLSGKMTEEPSYGALGDYILGFVGGLGAGIAFSIFMADAGFFGSTLAAVVGASVLIIGGRTIMALRSS